MNLNFKKREVFQYPPNFSHKIVKEQRKKTKQKKNSSKKDEVLFEVYLDPTAYLFQIVISELSDKTAQKKLVFEQIGMGDHTKVKVIHFLCSSLQVASKVGEQLA